MSFKANIAFVLHIHSFKNIALPHKARYALKATIYQGKNQKTIAMPFNIVETITKPKKNVSSQAEIQDNHFITKRFNIEYQEEEIELNDCCEFRLTLESFPQLKDEDLYLQFALMENTSCYFREEINAKVDLKQADTYRFKLENISSGVFRYSQGQFAKGFISSFSFTVFAMITDYRFHAYLPIKKKDSAKEKARERVENVDQLMKWSEKYMKNSEDRQRSFYQNYVKNLKYSSFCIQAQVSKYCTKEKAEIQPKVPIGKDGQMVIVSSKEFFEYVTSYFPETITEELIKRQIYRIYEQNFYFLQTVAGQMANGGFDMKILRDNYINEKKDLFGERVFRSLAFGKNPKDKDSNTKIANKMRKKRKISELKLIDQHLFINKQNQHYAFLQVNLPQSLKTKEYEQGSIQQVLKQLTDLKQTEFSQENPYNERNMLIVLVHGFQASTYDMEVIHREFLRVLPVAMFLNASCNQTDTTGDIEVMGRKLADQIKSYLNRFIKNQKEVIINFIGHSMGGVIARTSLRYLKDFSQQLGFYFSLSSPHLGYLNGVDLKIKAGLWFMRKTNKLLSLDQLSMQDSQSLKETFLYKLSTEGHLRNFKKIILLSSSQDSYVPWHSARIQYYDGSGSRSKLEKQMVQNILGEQIVHRVDIHFDIQTTKDLNSFIGRAAHINFLTQESILKLVNEAIPTLFEITQV